MKSLALFLFLHSKTLALQPQISSFSEFEEVPGLSDLAQKGDDEMVQLDAFSQMSSSAES